jgi:nucleotide-binding universal stress UspA family protein
MVCTGDPRQMLIEVSPEWDADTIVVGATGMHAWEQLMLGSVAQGVARMAARSVEIIRPVGPVIDKSKTPISERQT